MGWKTFKEKFKIGHNVKINDQGLCIGSGYVSDLVVVNLKTGVVTENSTFRGFLKEEYPQLLNATAEEILEVLSQKDQFSNSFPVYTWDGAIIIEEKAEAYGWPNVTHSGKIMHDNTYFKTREEAVAKAKSDNDYAVKEWTKIVAEAERNVEEKRKELDQVKKDKEILDKM